MDFVEPNPHQSPNTKSSPLINKLRTTQSASPPSHAITHSILILQMLIRNHSKNFCLQLGQQSTPKKDPATLKNTRQTTLTTPLVHLPLKLLPL